MNCTKYEQVTRFKQIEPQNAALFSTAILMLIYLTDAGLYLTIMTMINTDLGDSFVHKMASKGSVEMSSLIPYTYFTGIFESYIFESYIL